MDIIIPVHNSWSHARTCIESVLEILREGQDRVILVDDGSFPYVQREMKALTTGHRDVTLIVKTNNEGYLQAVIDGLLVSDSAYFVLLNSDTIVFERFQQRIETIFASDTSIGVINPVSVWANWTRVPFPRGSDIFSLNSEISSRWDDKVRDIYNASGFCFIVRRQCYDEIGGFSEDYHPGYWEETDFCMRALANGYRVVCAQGLFVFHHGWGSFGKRQRDEYMLRNAKIFRSKWQQQFQKLEEWYKFRNPIAHQNAVLEDLQPRHFHQVTASHPSVLYVVPTLKLYGGIISVVQLVNRLVLEGVRANILIIGKADGPMNEYGPMYFSPMAFDSEEEMLEQMPRVDVAVATHWSTVYQVLRISEADKCRKMLYFVQDYEPDFYPPGSDEALLAHFTYSQVPERICKTPWLRRILEEFGGTNHVIPLGLVLEEFADLGMPRRRRVLTMVRPGSERRNWPVVRKVITHLSVTRTDLEIAVFGHGYRSDDLPPGVVDLGLLGSSVEVRDALNESLILLDASTYQGFGRPGLEAMACGTAAVLTALGGITSYARHGHNCILVNPLDVGDICASVERLLDDEVLRRRLVERGLETAAKFCWRKEGEATAALVRSLADKGSAATESLERLAGAQLHSNGTLE